MNLNSMRIAHRLACAFGVLLLVMMISAVVSISKLASIERTLEDVVQDNNAKIKLNNDMAESVHVASRTMRTILLLIRLLKPTPCHRPCAG